MDMNDVIFGASVRPKAIRSIGGCNLNRISFFFFVNVESSPLLFAGNETAINVGRDGECSPAAAYSATRHHWKRSRVIIALRDCYQK